MRPLRLGMKGGNPREARTVSGSSGCDTSDSGNVVHEEQIRTVLFSQPRANHHASSGQPSILAANARQHSAHTVLDAAESHWAANGRHHHPIPFAGAVLRNRLLLGVIQSFQAPIIDYPTIPDPSNQLFRIGNTIAADLVSKVTQGGPGWPQAEPTRPTSRCSPTAPHPPCGSFASCRTPVTAAVPSFPPRGWAVLRDMIHHAFH